MAVTTFNYTGAVQAWVVPAGVSSITIECWGAEGGYRSTSSPDYYPGKGGYVKGNLNVTAGETLRIYVGGEGQDGAFGADGAGGWNGGGNAGATSQVRGGGGGGASDVRQGGTALSTRKIVGAGGGGIGTAASAPGGDGGAATGETGGPNATQAGEGGTQSAGGARGINTTSGVTGNAANGALGVGGKGDDANGQGGGGGGAGYYGGGGGGGGTGSAAGGGGSNYVGGVTSTTSTRGVRSGNGLVRFTYVHAPTQPGVFTSPTSSPVFTGTHTISWGASTDSDGDLASYEVDYSGNGGGSWARILSGLTETSVNYDFTQQIPTTVAKLRVRARDSGDRVSEWRESDVFTVEHNALTAVPDLISPINNDILHDAELFAFEWGFNDPNSDSVQTNYEIEYRSIGAGTWTKIVPSSPRLLDTFGVILDDTFDTLKTNVWRTKNQVNVSGGLATFEPLSASAATLSTDLKAYRLEGGSITFVLNEVTLNSSDFLSLTLSLQEDTAQIEFYVSGTSGNMSALGREGSLIINQSLGAFNIVNHKYLRFSESGESANTLRWESSPDGVAWTTLHEVTDWTTVFSGTNLMEEVQIESVLYRNGAPVATMALERVVVEGIGTTWQDVVMSRYNGDFVEIDPDQWTIAYIRDNDAPVIETSHVIEIDTLNMPHNDDHFVFEVECVGGTEEYRFFQWSFPGSETLLAQVRISSTVTEEFSLGVFDPVEHRFWRIREQMGHIYWDTSPDGETWTNGASYDHGHTTEEIGEGLVVLWAYRETSNPLDIKIASYGSYSAVESDKRHKIGAPFSVGEYEWRVRTTNHLDLVSNWSTTGTFTVLEHRIIHNESVLANTADSIMAGQDAVSKLYLGNTELWSTV